MEILHPVSPIEFPTPALLIPTNPIRKARQTVSATPRRSITETPNDLATGIQVHSSGVYTSDNFNTAFGEELYPGYSTKFGFMSKSKDADSGLYWFGTRWYDSEDRHWLELEPTGLDTPNFYSFLGNDPVNRFERDGRFGLIGCGIGIIAWGATGAIEEFFSQWTECGEITDPGMIGISGACGAGVGCILGAVPFVLAGEAITSPVVIVGGAISISAAPGVGVLKGAYRRSKSGRGNCPKNPDTFGLF